MTKLAEAYPDFLASDQGARLAAIVDGVNVVQIDKLEPLVNYSQTIVLANEPEVAAVLKGFKCSSVGHIVQSKRHDFYRDLLTSCMMIKRPVQFLTNPIPFFINNFEGESDYEKKYKSKSFALSNTDEKDQLILQLKDFLQSGAFTEPVIARVLLIADELLVNAFFNAPVDGRGTYTNMRMPRESRVKLSRPLRFFIAHDKHRLVIGCEDQYGSLVKNELLNKLTRAYNGQMSSLDDGAFTAGVGSKMMIDRSFGFYVAVKKQVKTLVFCSLELRGGEMRTELLPKNIHLCFWT